MWTTKVISAINMKQKSVFQDGQQGLSNNEMERTGEKEIYKASTVPWSISSFQRHIIISSEVTRPIEIISLFIIWFEFLVLVCSKLSTSKWEEKSLALADVEIF